jgi:transglutaminase-like putative cysteine protease
MHFPRLPTCCCRWRSQSLVIHSDNPIRAVPGDGGIGQRCWARGEGRLVAEYRAVVSIDRPRVRLDGYGATPVRDLPGPVVSYLLPSRYCESDRLENFVGQTFPGLSGGAMAAALANWVRENIAYEMGASDARTGAMETFAERRGVCRDFAHLLVAMARAAEIPARCVSAYSPISMRSQNCGWTALGG